MWNLWSISSNTEVYTKNEFDNELSNAWGWINTVIWTDPNASYSEWDTFISSSNTAYYYANVWGSLKWVKMGEVTSFTNPNDLA
jgi:hypothetical protein